MHCTFLNEFWIIRWLLLRDFWNSLWQSSTWKRIYSVFSPISGKHSGALLLTSKSVQYSMWSNSCIFIEIKLNILKLKGSTPFQGVIFYLWTDLDEICTAYVKLNSNSILFVKFFWISVWFSRKWGIFDFCLCFFLIFKRIEVKN